MLFVLDGEVVFVLDGDIIAIGVDIGVAAVFVVFVLIDVLPDSYPELFRPA